MCHINSELLTLYLNCVSFYRLPKSSRQELCSHWFRQFSKNSVIFNKNKKSSVFSLLFRRFSKQYRLYSKYLGLAASIFLVKTHCFSNLLNNTEKTIGFLQQTVHLIVICKCVYVHILCSSNTSDSIQYSGFRGNTNAFWLDARW
jgi:hypothetical protein